MDNEWLNIWPNSQMWHEHAIPSIGKDEGTQRWQLKKKKKKKKIQKKIKKRNGNVGVILENSYFIFLKVCVCNGHLFFQNGLNYL